MTSVKSLLKSARRSLSENDPEDAIDLCDDVIAQDTNNYYAYLFKGKALDLMSQREEALKAYRNATKINNKDPLAWKGIVLIDMESTNYRRFFADLLGLARAMDNEDKNLTPCVEKIRQYMNKHSNSGASSQMVEYYYRQIIPGLSELGSLLGEMVADPSSTLAKLINQLSKNEVAACKVAEEKLKFHMPANLNQQNRLQLNAVKYASYEKSEIPQLYEMLVNTETNDKRRILHEEEYLKYKFSKLLIAPAEHKKEIYDDVYETVSGMVLVHTGSQFAYDIFLDWTDPTTLADLDIIVVTDYIKMFGIRGLGAILYAYILSEVSPYERKVLNAYLKEDKSVKKRRRRITEEQKQLSVDHAASDSSEAESNEPSQIHKDAQADSNLQEKSVDSSDSHSESAKETKDRLPHFTNTEALDFMLSGIRAAKSSILGHRILINFFIHLKEYQYALDYSQAYVNLTLQHYKKLGIMLSNARVDSILSLAIIYTYHESPKNFPKAMELYSSVLKADPTNIMAKIGKGLIFMENRNYAKASSLLKDVVQEHPDDYKASQEYGWCLVQLDHYDEGRKLILESLKKISGTDASSLESKSITLWRVGQSYLLEAEKKKDVTTELIKTAFDYFVDSLKQSTSYPPCYTSLGVIFLNYFDKKNKALECFYKAFDLDPSEIISSHELVKHFSALGDWEMVGVLAGRVIESERAHKLLMAKDTEDPSWPYRMLGCAAMERQDDAKAIEYYQTGLRITPTDSESWIGLGEAYLGRGRLEASQKVFSHVLELAPENWYAVYLLAVSQTSMGEYDKSIANLSKLSEGKQKDEICVITSLYETLIAKAFYEVDNGFIGKSLDTIIDALEVLKRAVELDFKSQKLWKSLCDVLRLSITVQSHASKIPLDLVEGIIKSVDRTQFESPDLVTEVVGMDESADIDVKKLEKEGKFVTVCHYFAVEAAKLSLIILPAKSVKTLRAGLVYNLGITYCSWYEYSGQEKLRDCAIVVFRKAIQLESNNSEFWCSLGISSLTRSAKVSQHCFIKASSLNPKDTSVWIDLGVLYMYHGDFKLANECFVRAQSLGPSGPGPWAGEALVADALGDAVTAKRLYTHSYVLANGSNPLNSLLYGLSVAKRLVGFASKESNLDNVQEFNSAHFGLISYLKFYPEDTLALQTTISIIERIHTFEEGLELSSRLCSVLEEKYEDTPDTNILISFAVAKGQQARLHLGNKQYVDALKAADKATNLLEEAALNEEAQKCLLSSLAVTGLSLYFTGEFDKSLTEFNKILEVFPDSKRVVVLVSQVLYAFNEEEMRQAAVEELFKSIEKYGSSLLVALTIASISVVDRLEEYLPAVKEELLMIPMEMKVKDVSSEIPFFIDQINKRVGDHSNEKVWQRNAFLFPDESEVWNNLDTTVALNVSSNSKKVDASMLGEAYIKTGGLREIQRGLFLDSGNLDGYKALLKVSI
ncbi:hypothetical protein FOA43_001151 [Brettanomyces nanus]|uniref:Superkiller protein 3 n=1 Tax=Eeniella nana TaxID=13502 RepID=A0A875RXN6_EENNA|nr:uncharacterized protein FOA43_001151 [Brettanomyces nanus]QPG73836.1 hypothetical protein FOA43_001151 [Brettanomyces nanus]